MDIRDSNYDFNRRRTEGRIFAGIFLFLVGIGLLINELTNNVLPHWLFSWPMILILVGIYSGLKCRFRNTGWIFPFAIGLVFLSQEIGLFSHVERYMVPFFIILAGAFLILRPKRGRFRSFMEKEYQKGVQNDEPMVDKEYNRPGSEEDFFQSTSIFSGVKKVILSKEFKGADMTCIFGGAEIDLSHADIKNSAEIHISFIFGGGKLIIPSDWQVRNNVVPIFGGIDDKRNQNLVSSESKILILEGTCIFGGLEIRNY